MKTFHAMSIPETLAEIVDPRHSCLVVWDVQVVLTSRIFDQETYIPRLAPFVAELRRKLPVAYTLITPLPLPHQGAWPTYAMMRRMGLSDPTLLKPFVVPGTPEYTVPDAVAPQEGDLVLPKSTPNLFLGTRFESLMRMRGVQTLIFTGIATEMGIDTSARDAAARGFFPVVVSDGVSSMDQAAHERSLLNLAKVAIVTDMASIKAAI